MKLKTGDHKNKRETLVITISFKSEHVSNMFLQQRQRTTHTTPRFTWAKWETTDFPDTKNPSFSAA